MPQPLPSDERGACRRRPGDGHWKIHGKGALLDLGHGGTRVVKGWAGGGSVKERLATIRRPGGGRRGRRIGLTPVVEQLVAQHRTSGIVG